ncbi:MAG: hypothetical protein EB084_22585 [Proteobacteria bacterium]|nr:hypothetical protein [Pseudomonadota bacterium]
MTVWIVSEGCRYEGGEVHSVHATRESALVAVEKLLAEHREKVRAMREYSPSGFSSAGWDMQEHPGDRWLNKVDVIEVKEWTVTEGKP